MEQRAYRIRTGFSGTWKPHPQASRLATCQMLFAGVRRANRAGLLQVRGGIREERCGTRKGNVVYFEVEYRIGAELLLRFQCRSRTRTNPYTDCATRSARCCQVPGLDAETATTRPSS